MDGAVWQLVGKEIFIHVSYLNISYICLMSLWPHWPIRWRVCLGKRKMALLGGSSTPCSEASRNLGDLLE